MKHLSRRLRPAAAQLRRYSGVTWALAAVVLTALAGAWLAPGHLVQSRAPVHRAAPTAPAAAPAAPSTTAAPTTTAPAPSTTAPTTTTTTVPPSTTAAPTVDAAVTAAGARFTVAPYRGLGTWLDVYDWTITHAGGAVGPEVLDAMAAAGVQTLFIQASKWDSPSLVIEPERLMAFVERAHANGITVVGWFLPTLEDVELDLRRLLAIAALPIDGLAVDIESVDVDDVAERNRRLVDLSARLRAALPGEVIGAIPLEPVLIEDVNPHYWPGFPWAQLAPHYDVWMPMGYWTNRRATTPWRDPWIYTIQNVDRVRERIGDPGAPVHPIGGIADGLLPGHGRRFLEAAAHRKVIGGSLYDWRTSRADVWSELAGFRNLR